MENLRSVIRISILLHIITIAAISFVLVDKARLSNQNAVLQAEITDWQKAAVPALKSRGWEPTQEELQSLLPVELEIALNPCINKDGSWILSEECYSATPPPFNPSRIPIKIAIAR